MIPWDWGAGLSYRTDRWRGRRPAGNWLNPKSRADLAWGSLDRVRVAALKLGLRMDQLTSARCNGEASLLTQKPQVILLEARRQSVNVKSGTIWIAYSGRTLGWRCTAFVHS
jgi:hypothetical protein